MRYVLLMALCLVGCTRKSPSLDTRLILDDICQRELERHGDIAFRAEMRIFGNEYMDTYAEQAHDPATLWHYTKATQGICRGALIYLLAVEHPQWAIAHFKEMNPNLDDQERMHLMNVLHTQEVSAAAPLFFHYLQGPYSRQVRANAAINVDFLPQKKWVATLRQCFMQESDSEVLGPLILSLDLKLQPIKNLLVELYDHPHPDIHRMILTNLANSRLPDKQVLIERYRNHPEPFIAELAGTYLDRLAEGKDTEWTPQITRFDKSARVEVDPDSQTGLLRAIYDHNKFQVEAWLWKGALPGEPAPGRRMPLFEAASFSTEEIMRLLMEQGNLKGDLMKIRHHNGETVLIDFVGRDPFIQYSSKKDHNWKRLPRPLNQRLAPESRIPLLLELGAEIDAPNERGETALIVAAKEDRANCIGPLLLGGADASLRDSTGRTARDWASLLGNADALQALSQRAED